MHPRSAVNTAGAFGGKLAANIRGFSITRPVTPTGPTSEHGAERASRPADYLMQGEAERFDAATYRRDQSTGICETVFQDSLLRCCCCVAAAFQSECRQIAAQNNEDRDLGKFDQDVPSNA
jgi:hypothetical protein